MVSSRVLVLVLVLRTPATSLEGAQQMIILKNKKAALGRPDGNFYRA